MSQHFTLAFRQTTVVVHHKALILVTVHGRLDAGILRLAAREADQDHNTEEHCETRSRKHLRVIAQGSFETLINRQTLTQNDSCKRES